MMTPGYEEQICANCCLSRSDWYKLDQCDGCIKEGGWRYYAAKIIIFLWQRMLHA